MGVNTPPQFIARATFPDTSLDAHPIIRLHQIFYILRSRRPLRLPSLLLRMETRSPNGIGSKPDPRYITF
jgi:hypothetical protein